MASLYAEYLRERTNDEIIETPAGFVTYRLVNDGKTVYITDIYIKPEFRNGHLASAMADQVALIAKAKGCVDMIGSVVPSTKNSTRSLKVLLAYGMLLHSSSNDFIVFRKDL